MKPIFVSQRFRAYSSSRRWKLAVKIVAYAFGTGLVFVAGLFLYVSKDLPSPNSFNNLAIAQSTKIYDRTGQHILYDVHGDEKRTVIPFNQIPDNVKFASISLEDQEFYSHHGIKLTSIARSALMDILHRGAAQGGSTITQQLIKNSLLTSERTITRKAKEVILALEIEQKYSKDDILSMYLNQIPFGSSAYGIEAAAQTFFEKSAKDLTLPEAALLSALPNAPTYYSPFGSHTESLIARKNLALDRMANQGYITKEQLEEAKNLDVLAEISPKQNNISAPHFVMYVKEYLEQKYGAQAVEEGGLKVYTTLDWDMQQSAEQSVSDGAAKNAANKATNAALVAIDPKTGQILAMVGSKNYFDKSIDGQVNVALANRQPGSSFKPYVYLTAFTKGYTPETLLWDVPTNFSTDSGKDYSPQNYDGKFHGALQMKNALAMSLNVPAVKTLYLAGVKDATSLAKNLGITGLNDPSRYGLSLVLGGGEVTLLDHTSAYGTIANKGFKHDKTPILRIENKDGKIIEQYKDSPGQKVVEEKYIADLDYIMSTNDLRAPVFGDNNPLKFSDRPVAAKTGTTNDFRDGWTMGFTPSLAVGVWAGNNNNSAMKSGADGIVVAGPIWRSFMDMVLKKYPIEQFPKYEKEDAGKGVLNGKMENQDVKVCKMDKKRDDSKYCLANDSCPDGTEDKKSFSAAHDILYYVNKDDPRGDAPKDASRDPQYDVWEKALKEWLKDNKDSKGGGDSPPSNDCKSSYFKTKEEPKPTPVPDPIPTPDPTPTPTP